MTPVQTFIAHIVTICLVVAAAVTLAVKGQIAGSTALALIAAVTGVTLGAVVTTGGSQTASSAAAGIALASKTAPVTPIAVVPAPVAIVPAPVPPTPVSPGPAS